MQRCVRSTRWGGGGGQKCGTTAVCSTAASFCAGGGSSWDCVPLRSATQHVHVSLLKMLFKEKSGALFTNSVLSLVF